MIRFSEEWLTQFSGRVAKEVPVPMPANLKESVMWAVRQRQRVSEGQKRLYYRIRICAAACLALALLMGTAIGVEGSDFQAGKNDAWILEVHDTMDGFIGRLNTGFNNLVSEKDSSRNGR